MLLSPKQASFLAHSDAFINIADGAVRSGKTHSAMIRFAELASPGKGPPGDFAVVGKTERTVKRNVVYPLTEGLPRGAVRYIQGSGELYVFGRRCWVVGANDVRSEEKIRGMTLAGVYCNEATLYPHELWQQLIDRCSVDGAQILADCNPDSPYHWLNESYLSADLPKTDLKRWRFRLDDNPVLSSEYKDRLSRLHAPGSLWHRRMVEGEWVIAEGAIYDMFDEQEHVVDVLPDKFELVRVGVDYGTSNPTVFLLLGKAGDTWYVAKEHYYDAREVNRQKTDAEHSWDLRKFLTGIYPSSIEVDPSAASFIAQLRKDNVTGVRGADHAVLDGIRTVGAALTNGHLKIHRSCEHLIKEISVYAWDSDAQEKRGEDKPLKTQDHAPDALRYAAMRIWGKRLAQVTGF